MTPAAPPPVWSKETVEKIACAAPEFSGSRPLNESLRTKVMDNDGVGEERDGEDEVDEAEEEKVLVR
ncbi:hypothetical protein BGZ80_005984 [Entomortierella chlamydospora]|uniref:Uncharacterized protein n=1 Tax=Entomortierella chlamydospora TaxID=101097 RepID=A0A9P6T289_9FUNG|nr:hypothetical protein BGZ80_005984 [Entomortierella chlamydospora]